MVAVEEQKESSSCTQPKKLKRMRNSSEDEDELFRSNVTNANAMKSKSHKPRSCKKAKVESLYDTPEAQRFVLERANEVAANLAPEFPSVVKVMLPSHVSRVFWLGLPSLFCREHMPEDDTTFVLEDERGEEYQAKYLVDKVGLSGGWKKFAVFHNLQEGDIVIFHKVMPSKFKVYIVRSNDSDEVDCFKLDARIRQVEIVLDNATEVTVCGSSESGKHEPLDAVEILHEKVQKESIIVRMNKSGPTSDQSGSDSEDPDSEVLDGTKFSEPVTTFRKVSCIEDFRVTVSGITINAEMSKHCLTKYYELCCSQNSFLHDHVLEGLNCILAAGIISETVNIADAIRACKTTSSECNFSTWDKTLEASEMLGMNVGFLRTRLKQLGNLASESKLCKEAIQARVQAEKDLRTLEAKLSRAKEIISRLNSEIESLNTGSEKLEDMFSDLAKAPW